jgi:phage shock protein E
MRHILTLTLACLGLLAPACSESAAPAAPAADSNAAEALTWVEGGAVLLDVRTPAEFAGGHVRGAVNIPLSELDARVAEIEAERVVVYCQSGGRSGRAAESLRARGKEVLDVGGIGSWPRAADIER